MTEIKKKIINLARQLAKALQTIKESEEYTRLTQKDLIAKIAELEKKRTGIENRIAKIRLELVEANPKEAALVETTESLVARLEREIKEECHAIPLEHLTAKGVTFVDDEDDPSVTITVSKVQTEEVYDTDGLLEGYPELQMMEVEGDFVVTRTIDAAVLERLVEQGDVAEGVLDYRSLVKKRNPSVRIRPS